jgi:endonuclease
MKSEYEAWLKAEQYAEGTVRTQLSRIERIERAYPDIDAQYDEDKLIGLMQAFRYSRNDERRGLPNPTKLQIDGDLFNNLSSYRTAIGRYIRFREAGQVPDAPLSGGESEMSERGRIGLERDMQLALRANIVQLEPGLVIIDDGAERAVDSGYIDIMARDQKQCAVVIELKTGVAGQRAVAQILSYMGDIAVEEDAREVRGMLVAFDFDKKAISAARMVPSLELKKYRFHFTFSGIEA